MSFKNVLTIKSWSEALDKTTKAVQAEIDLILNIDKKYINNSEKADSNQESN
ncbi:hypothetical protein QYS48_33250 [Marivirga arenosa]|uniref:Uncharacterized protein n=1 Tax=Marivirga arenosa TaxID=3059076 RepID=A0AA51RD58_9BACT|nr:hypothetical protein [Marivirga sp. ABR2-2]WMN06665.1 hypothetical protein QYS48_33250 [Marivirga sp. ABR2-2]